MLYNELFIWQFICSIKYLTCQLSNKNIISTTILQHFKSPPSPNSQANVDYGFITSSVTFSFASRLSCLAFFFKTVYSLKVGDLAASCQPFLLVVTTNLYHSQTLHASK